MDNESNLGQPIPTGIITPTEILSPSDAAATEPLGDVPATREYSPIISSPTQMVADLMFAPIVFWASLSASYFRFFDLASQDRTASHRIG